MNCELLCKLESVCILAICASADRASVVAVRTCHGHTHYLICPCAASHLSDC